MHFPLPGGETVTWMRQQELPSRRWISCRGARFFSQFFNILSPSTPSLAESGAGSLGR